MKTSTLQRDRSNEMSSDRLASGRASAGDDAVSRVDGVYRQILARIIRGELPGGSELKSTRLAAELGVSRTPVVQALARLLADGIITQRMNMRAIVRPGAENWLVEIHELRLLLEPAAAARAATTMPIDVVESLVAEGEAVAPESDAEWTTRARDLDFTVHRSIADHANNQPLRGAILKCWEYKTLSYELEPERREVLLRGYQEHLSIIAALKARDAATASTAMELHLRQAGTHRADRRIV